MRLNQSVSQSGPGSMFLFSNILSLRIIQMERKELFSEKHSKNVKYL